MTLAGSARSRDARRRRNSSTVNPVAPQYLSIASPRDELAAGFDRIRQELDVPLSFGNRAQSEAQAVAARPPSPALDATDLPLVTIDPPGAMDLDQAVFIQRVGPGYRVYYAIADVPGFIGAGSALTHKSAAGAHAVQPGPQDPSAPGRAERGCGQPPPRPAPASVDLAP